MIDEELMLSGINRKNEKAWKALYDYYYAALCSFVDRILKGQGGAEDLVQDIFIVLWETDKKFDSLHDLTHYLYRACYNNTLIFIRNNQIHDSILDSLGKDFDEMTDDAYAETIKDEVVRQLYVHIQKLPTEQQKVILMSIEGNSCEEIARKLGVSVNTVKTHKSRGINSLRFKLKNAVYIFLI